MEEFERLLELVRRELGADDARLELGGREPKEDAVWCEVEGGMRLVAIFDEPVDDVASRREKLSFLARGFEETLSLVPAPPVRRSDPQGALDDALDVLASQAAAMTALVVDDDSPVLWGCSMEPRGPEDLADALRAAQALTIANEASFDLPRHLALGEGRPPDELVTLIPKIRDAGEERSANEWDRRLRVFAAVSSLRGEDLSSTRHVVHDPDLSFVARQFGGIYRLVLVFELDRFSELHAEAAMIHALPWIERLTTAIPPFEPDDRPGGRVVNLRRLRPV